MTNDNAGQNLTPPSPFPPPPGYRTLVPFDKSRHRGLGVAPDAGRFAAGLQAVFLTAREFPRASHDLPIVFARDAGKRVVSVAVTGIEPGRNLIQGDQAQWPAGVYCPAYVRRYPFYPARIAGADDGRSTVCVDEQALAPSTSPFILEDGKPTPLWEHYERLLNEMDHAERETFALCERLEQLSILKWFEASLQPGSGRERRIRGLLRVDEEKLRRLPADTIQDLLVRGYLGSIHAHLISLDNFDRLLQ